MNDHLKRLVVSKVQRGVGQDLRLTLADGSAEVRPGVTSCDLTTGGELILLISGNAVDIVAQGAWKHVDLVERPTE
jgi:hypothetical protein